LTRKCCKQKLFLSLFPNAFFIRWQTPKTSYLSFRNNFPLKLAESGEDEHPLLQQVQWSPKGNALVFVYKNDVFFRPTAISANTIRITSNGEPGVIFNGVPDWLYEGTK
jgi:hypothetical protein